MYFVIYVPLYFVFWTGRNIAAEKRQEGELLQNAVNALYNGLQYMEDQVSEINLDGAFGCRLVEGLLHAFLESRSVESNQLEGHLKEHLKMLSAKAGGIADEAKHYVKINQPEYYKEVGGLLERSQVLMWYPGRLTRPSAVVQPLPCSDSHFNETYSDGCLKEMLDSRSGKMDICNLSEACLDFMTRPRQRGYMITHQVLYFQIMEMENCVKRSQVKEIPTAFQDILCSNVMRDAEEIATSRYPLYQRDLFMEQIGLCGLWGYKDFYKPHWLVEILQWQQPSGCYTNRAKWQCTENLSEQNIRVKREEKILQDGCLSHKTTVGLLAISANIRFLAENFFEME